MKTGDKKKVSATMTAERSKIMQGLTEYKDRAINVSGLPMPFLPMKKDLPRGFPDNMITVIFGETNSGKSSLAIETMINGVREGYQFLYYSLDEGYNCYMNMLQIVKRKDIITMSMDNDFDSTLLDKIIAKGITVKTKLTHTGEDFKKELEDWKNYDYVVVDYFSKLTPETEGSFGRLALMLDEMKVFARDNNIGLILMQQAGKDANKKIKPNAILELSDIRGSHALASEAHLILSIGKISDNRRIITTQKQKLQRSNTYEWNIYTGVCAIYSSPDYGGNSFII